MSCIPNPPSETTHLQSTLGMPETLDDCTLNDMAHHDSTIHTAEESIRGHWDAPNYVSQFSNLSVHQSRSNDITKQWP